MTQRVSELSRYAPIETFDGVKMVKDKCGYWTPFNDALEAHQRITELEAEVEALRELAAARNSLLVAYRLNSHTRAGKAIDRITAAEEKLVGMGVETP